MAETTWLPKKQEHHKFRTGLKPTPRYKLARLDRFRPPSKLAPQAPRKITVPSFLEMWLNDQYGDCVTAESAAALAMYSVMVGKDEVKITDATVRAFCDKYGVLNGADLVEVCDDMMQGGFVQDAGWHEGPHLVVDFSTETVLQAALELGPVKIGIDSGALPGGAGNANGWSGSGGSPGQFGNEDHCVGIWNYGPSKDLFAALKAPMPSNFPANGYHLYTWSTVGVVDHAWIMSTCGEALLRTPTSKEIGPGPNPPPPPPPPPPPEPGPTPGTLTGTLTISGPADAVGTFPIGGTSPEPQPGMVTVPLAALTAIQVELAALIGGQGQFSKATRGEIRMALVIFDSILTGNYHGQMKLPPMVCMILQFMASMFGIPLPPGIC